IYRGERSRDLVRPLGPHQPRGFLAVAQENQRRPELNAEGAPETPPACVRDLDMAHVGMRRECLGDRRFRPATPAAPGTAELEQRRAGERVDFAAPGLDLGV